MELCGGAGDTGGATIATSHDRISGRGQPTKGVVAQTVARDPWHTVESHGKAVTADVVRRPCERGNSRGTAA
jgi:hypothetical protein